MRELTRSNDAVFLSWISASLSEAGISAVTLDGFSSGLLQPLNVTAGQRIMVADEDYWNAWAVLADAEGLISEDEILGARVSILQPKSGFRAAIDPVLLAASVPAEAGERVLELGSGTGAAALALAARTKARLIDGVDLQPNLVALANRSALLNGVSDRVRFHVGDILALPAPAVPYDHVMAN
ncbi:MAG: methyltransferase domain-containing protein, partial [Proteobacteria bacterium]|nr:methyltransferase domain-containing protein [Pseudomonadota bacterium]